VKGEASAGRRVSYQEFRVEVRNLSKVKVTRPGGTTLEGNVRWDRLTKDLLEVFDRQLAEGRINYRQELTVIGSHLYRTLFSDRVAQAFEDDFAYVRKKKNFEEIVMRLKLEFHPDADELAKLPWEYLYAVESDGSKGRFIAAEEQLVLTRFVPLDRNYPDDPDDRRLRILAAVSAPVRELTPDSSPAEPDYQDLGPIKADPVISQLTSLEKEQPDRFQVKKLDSPTQRALADCVGEFKPHVLHFIGHGKYGVRHDEGYLAMIQEDDRETACWVDDESFADCFREWPPPLVFLQACEGARTESYNIFRGMALRHLPRHGAATGGLVHRGRRGHAVPGREQGGQRFRRPVL